MRIGSGAAIAASYSMLLSHFRNQGTPIMIGGAAYAYTILGIEYNALTGDVLLLILDPHYTGSDDSLQNILNKGWCKWKKCDMFRAEEFYNLCLPSVPKLV